MRSNMLMVLNTLERHSDSEHPLSVNEIRRLIGKDFKRSVSAKTVARILTDELTDNDAFPLREYFDVRKDEDKLKSMLEDKGIPKAESEYILYDAAIWHINGIFERGSQTRKN